MSKIEIESAFVEAWTRNEDQHPAWGMKTAESHSRKNDAGKFETVARTYRTVKVSRDSGIDLTQFRKGDRVQVWGREVTEIREYEANGVTKTARDLVVWADRVEPVGTPAPQAAQEAPADPWATEAPPEDPWAGTNDYTGGAVPF